MSSIIKFLLNLIAKVFFYKIGKRNTTKSNEQIIEKINEDKTESKVGVFNIEIKASHKQKIYILNSVEIKLKQLFNSHNIDDKLIPLFIKENIDSELTISISEIENLKIVFDKLTDNHLIKISDFFGTKLSWLYRNDELYEHSNYYYKMHEMITFIIKTSFKENKRLECIAVRTKCFNRKEDHPQPLILVFRVPVAELFKKTIYKYFHVHTNWKWHYWRTRQQVKSFIHLFTKSNPYVQITGQTVSLDEINKLFSRKVCPDSIIRKNRFKVWNPYEYVSSENEYPSYFESDEDETILSYIKEQGYREKIKEIVDFELSSLYEKCI